MKIGSGWKKRSNEKAYAVRREIIRVAKDRPCADCGIRYPVYVMDFDHARGVKEFNIGSGKMGHSIAKLLNEIAKCDVVCSNCHRIRTWRNP